MSKTTDKNANADEVSSPKTQKPEDRHLKELEQRLRRLEKRLKNNERFGKTFADCLGSQVVAIEAVTATVRRSLREDADVHDELSAAIKEYDRHKIRRWFSGFFGALFRILALAAAAFMGAFIYWVFSGQ